MKALFVLGLLIFTTHFAWSEELPQQASTSTLDLEAEDIATEITPRLGWTEGGYLGHSASPTAGFIDLAVGRDFGSRFAIGFRALLPTTRSSQSSDSSRSVDIFLAQIFGRIYLQNNENKFFFEPSLAQGLDRTTFAFSMIGLSYGYQRQISSEIGFGVNAGADYGYESQIYSKLGAVGTYTF